MKENEITFAKKEWVPKLTEIWKESFHDEDSYIDFFFTNRFEEKNTLVYLQNNQPVAMASLLPCKTWKQENDKIIKHSARYIYAVATKPEYRGQGMSTTLMNYILEFLKHQNEIGILVPATKDLIFFYEERGFYPSIHKEERMQKKDWFPEIMIHSLEEVEVLDETISSKRYKKLRDKYFGMEGYIEWTEDAILYAMKENEFIGGVCLELICEGESHILMGYKSNDEFVVRETTLSNSQWERYAMAIANKFHCSRIVQREMFCMSTKEGRNLTYFSLALE